LHISLPLAASKCNHFVALKKIDAGNDAAWIWKKTWDEAVAAA
jgi:hypothetical protein